MRLDDLYARGFAPVPDAAEWRGQADSPANRAPVAGEVAALVGCDTLVFVYPTWWGGLPAMLKGWLDRVLLPGVAYHPPARPGDPGRPALTRITRLGAFTSCGASRWQAALAGNPGKRTLLRSVRAVCAPGCRTTYLAPHRIDATSAAQRAAHLARAERRASSMI